MLGKAPSLLRFPCVAFSCPSFRPGRSLRELGVRTRDWKMREVSAKLCPRSSALPGPELGLVFMQTAPSTS